MGERWKREGGGQKWRERKEAGILASALVSYQLCVPT